MKRAILSLILGLACGQPATGHFWPVRSNIKLRTEKAVIVDYWEFNGPWIGLRVRYENARQKTACFLVQKAIWRAEWTKGATVVVETTGEIDEAVLWAFIDRH